MRIAVAGNGPLAVRLMQALIESGHEVVGAIQNGRKTRGVKRKLTTMAGASLAAESTVVGLAVRHRVPVVWIDRMDEEELAPMRDLKPDLLLVGGFDIILKKPILALPRLGCVNVHSSLLPRHRGPNPFAAVVLAGETESGVTFHVMDEGIDTGDILDQFAFPIAPHDTAMDVYNNACDVAGRRVVEVMDRISREGLNGTPQDAAKASYDKRPEKEDAYIDWTKPALEIERMVRAFRPVPLARFRYHGHTVIAGRVQMDGAPATAEPGTIVALKPFLKVATGHGTLTMLTAYSIGLLPWVWPPPWGRPKLGEKVG